MILSLVAIAYIIFYFFEGADGSTTDVLLNLLIFIYCIDNAFYTYSAKESLDKIEKLLANSDFNSTDSNGHGINGRLDKLESYIKNELRSIKNRIK